MSRRRLTATLSAMALFCTLWGTPTVQAEPGADKLTHFRVSAALSATATLGASLWADEPWQRAAWGAGLTLGLGAAKELADVAGTGDASVADMGWNALGAVTGAAVSWLVMALFE